MSITAIDILGTIRDNATDDYIARVPEATRDNLGQIGQAITADKNIMNDFVTALINKIAITSLKSRMYNNPLAKLKTGYGKPMGSTIEEIFINPAIDQGYSTDGTLLLKTSKPDGKACYYGLNRQSTYPTTINKQQLIRAFTSERAFMNFYNGIIASLYSGDAIDEFNLTKDMFAKNIDDGHMKLIEADLTQPKELAKAMANISDYFTFANTEFNGYNLVNADKITAGETKCITFCETSRQCLLVRADVFNEINFEVLASMFHMELATLKAMTIKIDSFPTTKFDTYAVLCDVEAINVIDDVFETDNQYIGSSMQWNIWLQHWQWLYLSLFGNCVAFGKSLLNVASITVSGDSTITTDGGTLQLTASVSPSTAVNKTVSWTSSDVTKATVSSSGLVTAVADGTVTITATSTDGTNVTGSKLITISNQV